MNINISDSVTSIGNSAFSGCKALETITIGSGVTDIDVSVFNDCDSLISFNVVSQNEHYFSESGVLFKVDNKELVVFPRGRAITVYKIPDFVVSIGNTAFGDCKYLTDIIIPDTVTSIGEFAFAECVSLKNVSIPDSLISIGAYAFFGCESLTNITLPISVKEIGERAFGCSVYYGDVDPSFKIVGVVGSMAEKYAKEYGVVFIDVASHTHSYTSAITKQPTCTETGTKTFTCSCGDSYTETIPAKGHTEATVIGNAATCTTTGLTDGKKCSVCGTTTVAQQTIAKKAHTEVTVTGKAATCTATGLTDGKKCSVCGTVTKEQETIKASGHKEVVIPAVAPTYTTVGKTEGKKCSVCGTVTVAQKDVAKLTLATPVVTVKNSATGVKVTWGAIDGAESYKVYRKTYSTKTKKYGSWKTCGTVTTTSYVDTKAKSGTKYVYTVKALNGDVKSGIKSSSSILFLSQPTVKIANNASGVKVTWNKITGATGYKVYRAEYVNGKWSGWKSVKTIDKGSTVSWTDTKAKSGVKYKYTVKAVNGKTGSTYKSSSSLLYLAQPKVAVKALSNGIKVAWVQSTGATSYKIYRSEYNAKTKKWSSWKSIKTAKSTSKSYTDKSAKKGVKYRYTVKAVNGKTASAYKSSASVKR